MHVHVQAFGCVRMKYDNCGHIPPVLNTCHLYNCPGTNNASCFVVCFLGVFFFWYTSQGKQHKPASRAHTPPQARTSIFREGMCACTCIQWHSQGRGPSDLTLWSAVQAIDRNFHDVTCMRTHSVGVASMCTFIFA